MVTTPAYGWNAPAVNSYDTSGGAATLTTDDIIINRIVECSDATNGFVTPTAAQMVAALSNPAVGDSFQFVISTPDPNTALQCAGGAGISGDVGTPGSPPFANESVNVTITLRLTNVTPGMEAGQIY